VALNTINQWNQSICTAFPCKPLLIRILPAVFSVQAPWHSTNIKHQ
jgi:hypothetical protein